LVAVGLLLVEVKPFGPFQVIVPLQFVAAKFATCPWASSYLSEEIVGVVADTQLGTTVTLEVLNH
jgi:hypothetical protein